jgi:hypothetical protein
MCHQRALAKECGCYWPNIFIPSYDEKSAEFATFNK